MGIKLDNGTYYEPTHQGGVVVESDELTREQRQKATTDLTGTPTLALVRTGWQQAAQNVDPVVTGLNAPRLSDSGTKVKATRLFQASQDTGGTVKDMLDAQEEWQDFLVDKRVPMKDVLSVHRSFGLEYEFATWELINQGNAVPSHTEVGESDPLSELFDVPFILETDAQEELEVVAPPLLAGDATGGVNKVFMKGAHELLMACLKDFREEHENEMVAYLPFEDEGLGKNWSWEQDAQQIQIASERKKWATKPDQIGYQLNVALTPEEIAAEIARVQEQALSDDHGKLYKKIRQRFLTNNAYTSLGGGRQTAVRPALLILAKGLSNSIAIPTLTLVAETKSPWPRGDLHSYVKDLHGLWIKDSVPNATVSAVLGKPQARKDLESILDSVRDGQDLIPRDVLTNVPAYRPQGAAFTEEIEALLDELDPAENQSTRLKKAAEAEAIACLEKVKAMLGGYVGALPKNPKTEFLGEAFGSGAGVRKDTYANIGESQTSKLHLAEMRSVAKTDEFLG